MSNTFDVIVIGAGAVGSAAAYFAARSGQHVLLLEQFEIDHQNGSSYGASRIIRYAYDHPVYVELAKSTFPLWAALEAESGETLYTQTGGIDFGRVDQPTLRGMIDSLAACNIPHEVLEPDEAHQRFPQFRFDDDMKVLYQGDAGVLRASLCVRTHVRLAQQHGAVVRDQSPVTRIEIKSDSVEIQAGGEIFSAAALIVVPGPWGIFASIGLDLPLTPVKTHEAYFDSQPAERYDTTSFPIFIAHTLENYGFMPYGLPGVDGSGLKVGLHGGPPIADMNAVDRTPSPDVIEKAQTFIKRHIPGGSAPLKYARVCLYTMTPDEHFIIDRHPAHDHVAISASCSGHAFKFSNIIGQILTDLVCNGTTQHDIGLFSLSRFDQLQSV
jgi:monomeric sarcosine oxidase